MMNISAEFYSVGANRNPAAADWDQNGSQLLAFGADNSIAIWEPSVWQNTSWCTQVTDCSRMMIFRALLQS